MRNSAARVSDPNEFFSNAGSAVKVEYSPKVMSDGRIDLLPSGKLDIKAMINSQRELTDINYIVKQIENGNYDVINPAEPFYGDSTKFPQTFAEALQLRIDAERSFYELSPEKRQLFDNDINQYFASAGSPEWLEKLGLVHKEVSPSVDVPSDPDLDSER